MTDLRRSDGFSLVELLFVVVILTILIAIVIASYTLSTGRAQRVTCEANRNIFDRAGAVYESENGFPPTSIEDLRDAIGNFDSIKTCPSDPDTTLRWNAMLERTVCDYHGE